MVSSFTPNKRIEQPGFNDYPDTWDVPVNNDWALIDLALGGQVTINTNGMLGNIALSPANYKPLRINLTGTPAGALNFGVPSGVGGLWVVRNHTAQAIGFYSLAGGGVVNVPSGTNTLATCDGSSFGMVVSTNTPPAAAGANLQVQYNAGGILAANGNFYFDGVTAYAAGLYSFGNTILGQTSGHTVTINGLNLYAPNGLAINNPNFYVGGGKVGIGTTSLGAELLTVAGVIYSTAGGIKFPDGSILSSATGIAPVGGAGWVQYANGIGGFAAEAAFTYNAGSNTLAIDNLSVAGLASIATANIGTLNLTTLGVGGALSGFMMWWPGPLATLPSFALPCWGQEVSRGGSTAGIFARISTQWGAGNGSTTFNLPDLRGRVPAMADDAGGAAPNANRLGGNPSAGGFGASPAQIGQASGDKTHVQTLAELVSHNHAQVPSANGLGSSGDPAASAGGGLILGNPTDVRGGGQPFNITQPTAVGLWVILL